MNKKNTPSFKKLKKAWRLIPEGGKGKVFEKGYKPQTVSHILLNGRVDEKIILDLLKVVKNASKKLTKEVNKSNDKIQSL